MDWFEFNDKNYIVIEDDASRFIIHFGSMNNGIQWINDRSRNTVYITVRRRKDSEPNKFRRYFEENGIIHIKASVKHLQSNGKLERLIFTLKDIQKYFNIWEEVVNYYNNRRMHMSLYEDRIITPAIAY